jgi:hypothetical protein
MSECMAAPTIPGKVETLPDGWISVPCSRRGRRHEGTVLRERVIVRKETATDSRPSKPSSDENTSASTRAATRTEVSRTSRRNRGAGQRRTEEDEMQIDK